ncbi:exocyst complex component EXO70H1-like [Neltuma alba]|uniref:exocyst complex component EXO70H1-like n=1 Tax=Neltuma alba TaxID=207710 RepID=UPI0010A45D90|nr:exocyst complex component EXO70H1-like [Prosopis alba]
MKSICFHPTTPSFSATTSSNHSLSSDASSSTAMSFSDSSIDRCIEDAQALIHKWNPQTSAYAKITSLFYDDKSEAMHYIKCVNQLHKAMHLLHSHQNPLSSQKLILANNLMQLAMKRLQKEFYQILSINRAFLDPESLSTVRTSSASVSSTVSDFDVEDATAPEDDLRIAVDSISELEQVSTLATRDLRSIATCMISCGYAKECLKVYRVIRKSIIDEGIYRLNLDKLKPSQVNKMDWQILDLKIKIWLEAVKVAVRTLFNGERKLCDDVFATSDSIRESCFADISKDGASILFAFPQHVVSKVKNSPPEKMFRVLDMHIALTSLLPEIQSIFSFYSTSEILNQVQNSLLRLSESVRTMLSHFESTIQKDPSKSLAKSGGVHPLTTQAMDCLSILSDYSNVLSEIFADWSPPPKSPVPEYLLESPDSNEASSTMPSFSARIPWLIFVLLCKLDSKTKHCKCASQSYLFLANNLQHVIDTARNSNLQYVLGDEWIGKHEAKVKGFVNKYEKLAWAEVISCLPRNPKAAMTAEEARVIFRNFNFRFEEAYRKQNSYTVPARRLREEIRESIARKMVPMYEEFYMTHRTTVGSVREMTKYVTFQPDDVKGYLANLFFAGINSGSVTTSSSPSLSASLASSPRRQH